MKQIFFYFLAVILILGLTNQSCNKSNHADATSADKESAMDKSELPVFKFESETYDFGKVTEGEKVICKYKFTNVGKSDLLIKSAYAGCGCTVPKYSSEPVAPGATGEIEVVFNTANRGGMQNKSVTIEANTDPTQTKLTFSAEVVAANKK